MKKLATTGLAVLFVVASLMGVPSAEARPATEAAQRGRTFSVTVNRDTLNSGQRLIVTAVSNGPCIWLLEWNGERKSIRGRKTFRAAFTAPEVSSETRIPLHATCFYSGTRPKETRPKPGQAPVVSSRDEQTIEVFIPPSWRHDEGITVMPEGTVLPPTKPPHHGGLPNTGGPSLWLLLAALTALALGGFGVRAGRRRPNEPEALVLPFWPGL